jgi:hypothetical protein
MLEFVEVAKDSIAVRRAMAHQRIKQKNKTAHNMKGQQPREADRTHKIYPMPQ